MKKLLLIPVVIGSLIVTSCGNSGTKVEAGAQAAEAGAGAVTYSINPSESKVLWLAKKVTGQHNGTVAIKSGELKAENGQLQAGKFTFDMSQIIVEDLTDAEMNTKLTNHLKSDDFFAVEKNPEATFELVSAEPIANAAAGSPNYTVKGNLTIKGITKAITFPATINIGEKNLNAAAEFDIDRTEWDIRYGSGKFFEGLGDKAIYDAFTVRFNLNATA